MLFSQHFLAESSLLCKFYDEKNPEYAEESIACLGNIKTYENMARTQGDLFVLNILIVCTSTLGTKCLLCPILHPVHTRL